MDSIVHTALEQICSHGTTGITIPNLWFTLQSSIPLCPNVKKSVWLNLITVPALKFESKGVVYSVGDEAIKDVDRCEIMGLKIVADEQLRNTFVGIYDIKASDSGISAPQRRVLERLAIARTNGITQSELAKELGIKGNNIFYVLKNLESRGLIVRQSTVLRKKEADNEGGTKNSIVTTNMLYLYRYAKHLGCQQRLEVIKEDTNLVGNDIEDQCFKEDVHVKDYLPALKAICDKLENAPGKVLVISDIKRDLGYRRTSGHRAWRNISHRLKDARVVEEFCAKVNKKEVSCLRLLKEFSPKNFEPKTRGCGDEDLDSELSLKVGNRGQINDQLVELPIEHQIYDMVDAEGSKGLTITEVCKRLGISNKRYYSRLLNMFSRFGMHLEAESHNRGVAYRVWTSGNLNSEGSNTKKQENVVSESGFSNPRVAKLDVQEKSAQIVQEVEHSTSQENEKLAVESEISHVLPSEGDIVLCPSSSENVVVETRGIVCDTEVEIVSKPIESNVASLEASPSASSTPRRRRSYHTYPCLTLNAASTLREKRIIELLHGEKFIIKAELHRRLESLEKEKHTMMDRKTLERSLNKLQQEGHCKCIRVSVPVVTNCGRSRTMDVVLHPSFPNVSHELLGQIHERLRTFDMEIRGQGSSRLKKDQAVPVLSGVQRILRDGNLDNQTEKFEAMRANGYVAAKMVRTKLLHIFLWGYLRGLDEDLLSGKHGYDLKNPHSTCKPFELEAAIKAMPLELFLQVVGSAKRNEDMIDKCRNGLLLSDLPDQEYKNLMDTQATAHLSVLVDILRRLKLMRMVSLERLEEADQALVKSLTHALELKPYIEEPVAVIAPPSCLISLDIRPQVRHDFVLSSGIAVEEYWNTLEYCYAAADSKAALHAFPGSAVHEIFLFRSWASVRVMTADQRAKLLRRVGKDALNKKLSFKECEKIAKDLHLTLEQVLRVYYDKRRKPRTRLRGVSNNLGEDILPLRNDNVSSPRKRKRSSEGRSLKNAKVDNLDGELSEQRHDILSIDQLTEENFSITSSVDNENNSLKDHVDDHMETIEEPGSNGEDEESHSFIKKCALSRLNPPRSRRFSWTETADRKLVIEYAIHRAALGADFHRIDWASLPNLPAPPLTCKRRMALLNSSILFRKAVMRLCNILSERYANHLSKFQIRPLDNDDSGVLVRDYSYGEDCNRNLSDSLEHIEAYDYEERWDDFNDEDLKTALDEVLKYKRVAPFSSLNTEAKGQKYKVQNHSVRSNVSARRTRFHRLPRKYIKLLNTDIGVSRRAYGSLAVSNAAELFKLVFLSTSTAPQVPNSLAETLRRYSEHDLFAAFDYLREKRIMIGGSGTSPFVLSQHFLRRMSSSPFPSNTGKRAAKFASWLHKREQDLIEKGVDLTEDMQCGDVLHLLALVSSGEVSISPCLPDQGVGEAEDSKNSKRKSDNFESGDKSKKPKTLSSAECEIISRREKGFPGIKLSLSCDTISKIDAVEIFKDLENCSAPFPVRGSDEVNLALTQNVEANSSPSNSHIMEVLNSRATIPTTLASNDESPWEAMTCYAENLVSVPYNQEQGSLLSPEIFKNVYSVIQMAGDQGLRIEEIQKAINVPGEKMAELIVEVLETFGRALKVNGYDSIHVVDSLYRSKYFLASFPSYHPSTNSKGVSDDNRLIVQPNHSESDGGNVQNEIRSDVDEMHRVTILNLPEGVPQPSSKMQKSNEIEGNTQAKIVSSGRDREGEVNEFNFGESNLSSPILPWINGDGTVNKVIYRGLIRRVLGIVMQNPGILEDNIVMQMRVLNPQSCKTLLELMILDNHIIVRKMSQATSGQPPALLDRLFGKSFKKSKTISRKHFFANPMSTSFL